MESRTRQLVGLWGLLWGLLFWAPSAQAAYSTIVWDWDQGSGPAITGFIIKCGRTSGSYSLTVTVPNSAARSYDLYSVTNGKGQWYCTVSAYTASDESANGNETNFVLPIPPMILTPQP